jgi:hypothetical protein
MTKHVQPILQCRLDVATEKLMHAERVPAFQIVRLCLYPFAQRAYVGKFRDYIAEL